MKSELTKVPNGSLHIKDLGTVFFGHRKKDKEADVQELTSEF
jgi:hypothetical protein